ncbi:hypothetical protein SAMN04487926_1592 [Paraburkholderia steynii]|uniref:Uncharacterized protein n=1 Tax=Paraburkholderia steynii TaxID=1245441 RepID=A0A7Z7FRC7_9BURK|nr:hypothetical protein SAMN04487926_1592 [Paraburkholderia steynii]
MPTVCVDGGILEVQTLLPAFTQMHLPYGISMIWRGLPFPGDFDESVRASTVVADHPPFSLSVFGARAHEGHCVLDLRCNRAPLTSARS